MIYNFEKFELDTRRYQLTQHGKTIAIEPQVFDLLKYLLENRGRLISREELFNTIWSGRVVSDATLSNHVKSARKAIGDNGQAQSIIKTVHGRGYQFVAKARETINHGSDFTRLSDHRANEHTGPFMAVLPFQNMSRDPEQRFFADGVAEDLTTELSRFTDIQVIARHTAFQYRGASLDVKQVCRELGVDYLIEGSIQRTRDEVRVSVQLIEAQDGTHIWAEKYDGPLDQIFRIQDEITGTIVSTISGQIRSVEMERALARSTINLRAYDHLLRGLSLHKNGYVSYDDEVKATEEFTRAIDLDPGFSRARAWIICSKAAMWDPKTDELIDGAIEEAKFALSLDEKESETHRILGSLYLYARRFELAGHHYEEARRLSPNDAHIAVKLARYYAYTGDLENALKTVKRAMRLNPLGPGWYWQELGIVYYSMESYQKAIDAFHKNWETNDFDLAWIAASHVAKGDMVKARDSAKEALERNPEASATFYSKFETYRDENTRKRLIDRMVKAGIPV